MSKADSKKSGIIDFFIRHSKKSMLFLIVFTLITVGAAVTFLLIYTKSDVIATLGDKKVLKTDYEDAKAKCDGFYRYNDDSSSQKRCSETEIEDQILRKALEIEAEKRNITVTDGEINKKYNDLVSVYESEDAYKATIKVAYGWNVDYVKANLKRDILQEKLAPHLLNERTVSEIFVRYDWTEATDPTQRKADEDLSKEKMEKVLYPLLKNKSSLTKEEVAATIGKLRAEGEPWNKEWVVNGAITKGLNAKIAGEKYSGKEDWQAISKLQKVGDITGIVKSSGGYFAAYRLEGITNGVFSDWEEFKKDAVKKAKVNSLSYKYKKQARAVKERVGVIANGLTRGLGIKNVFACHNCGASHFSAFYGYLVDGSNSALRIVQNDDIGVSEGSIGEPGYCCGEWTGGTRSSVANGYFKIGNETDISFKAVSCMVRWNVRIAPSGYHPVAYGERSVYQNGTARQLDYPLNSQGLEWPFTQKTGETYSGHFAAQNTDGDAHIWLKPDIPTPSCSGALKQYVDGVEASDNANLAPGSMTTSWNGGPYAYSVRYTVTKNGVCTLGYPSDTCANNLSWSRNTNNSGPAPQFALEEGTYWTVLRISNSEADVATCVRGPFNVTNAAITKTCPTLSASPSSVRQGESVKLSWSGGQNVQSFDIKQQPPEGGTVATLYSGAQAVTNGRIEIIPSVTTDYFLDVTFTDGTKNPNCSLVKTNVQVSPNQTGKDKPAPPN